jgi:hypothetical protein
MRLRGGRQLVGQILAVGVCQVTGDVHLGRVMLDARMLAPGLFCVVMSFRFLMGRGGLLIAGLLRATVVLLAQRVRHTTAPPAFA